MGVKSLAQEHNAMSLTRARTQTSQSGDKLSNHEAIVPPLHLHVCSTSQFLFTFSKVFVYHARG